MGDLLKAIQETEIPDIFAVQSVLESSEDQSELFRLAVDTRTRVFGSNIALCAAVEMSNHCSGECVYCGLSGRISRKMRYRMQPGEVVDAVLEAAQYYHIVILNTHRDVWYTAEILTDILKEIRQNNQDVLITMAAGERSPIAYQAMRSAGANRFLIAWDTTQALMHEQANGSLADNMEGLQKLGFEVAGGCIVGLPGQTASTVAAEILVMREHLVEMAGFGPFIPHPDTMVASYPEGSTTETLRALAMARILLAQCNLPVTYALRARGCVNDALQCGANAILQDVTPEKYRKMYDPYPGREETDGTIKEQHEQLVKTVSELGLTTA